MPKPQAMCDCTGVHRMGVDALFWSEFVRRWAPTASDLVMVPDGSARIGFRCEETGLPVFSLEFRPAPGAEGVFSARVLSHAAGAYPAALAVAATLRASLTMFHLERQALSTTPMRAAG